MKFVYGKQDWKNRSRGQENCYLLTNGLGGFSSATMINSCTRNDHALLMACVQAPNHRYNVIHRLEELLQVGEKSVHLSSQEYLESSKNGEGYQYLSSFIFEDYPSWNYQINGVEIRKQIAMKQQENLVAVQYQIENRTSKEITFKVIPHLEFIPKGKKLEKTQKFSLEKNQISSGDITVYFQTNGIVEVFPSQFCENLYYSYDACDGREDTGNTCINHQIIKQVKAHSKEQLELIYSMKEIVEHVSDVFEEGVSYRNALVQISELKDEIAKVLVKSANQFISERESTKGKTILAGFPFFEDWGRDTMIALAGCCISTRQFAAARSILRTFATYCKDGLMPNLFPEGQNEPRYNTVDAALLFINAVYIYNRKKLDLNFVQEMWPFMQEIVKCYQNGTDFNIHMDEDGLIIAGQGYDQVTWMDVRVGDILPTPRHGKPVEINAYWYNALKIMQEFSVQLGYEDEYGNLANKVQKNFCEKFWNVEQSCLKDVLCAEKAENQIRCNQIWAVSLPFTMLSKEQEKQVVDTVFEKLYTPYGLRTLDKDDSEFHGFYGGAQLERDLAYHQGTVWVFPLGAYYLAYLKTREYSAQAKNTVKQQLEVMESALAEGCIGQLPEIYDGENPTSSKGCFAQAWSVGEILRVYEALETE